jgi:hypothetical protein
MVEGDLRRPSVVIFHSEFAPATQPGHKVKAFALNRIHKADWEKLEKEITEQFDSERNMELARVQSGVDRVFRDSQFAGVRVHPDTGLLIVEGPEWAVEAAESFVNAWRDNEAATAAATHPPSPLGGK